MKYLFVITILSGILLQSASTLSILIRFQMNKDYIAKNLCVQKKVKRNCCQGSCHLAKELNKEEKKEQTPGNSLKNKNETSLFCHSISFSGKSARSYETITLVPYCEATSVSVSSSVFHPPC